MLLALYSQKDLTNTTMDSIRIQTAQNIDIQYEIAGISDRIIAALIDMLIIVAYSLAIWQLLSAFGIQIGPALSMIAFFLIPILYYLLSEMYMNGQTIGKRQMSIRVARADGGQPTFSNYLLRWMLFFVDAGFMFIGVLVMLFTEKGQRIGDLAAGTIVIKLKNRVTIDDTIYVELREDYVPTFPQVEVLTDADMEVIKDVLKVISKPETSPAVLDTAAHAKTVVERKMGIAPVPLSPRQFLGTVIGDYNYYKGIL